MHKNTQQNGHTQTIIMNAEDPEQKTNQQIHKQAGK